MKTIFIVDSSEHTRMAAKAALEGMYLAYALPSAERMFQLLEKTVPDLILMAISMPETGGFAALAALKAHEKFKDIPVIFLSAAGDAEAEVRGFEIGAIDFIHTPFSPPVLIRRIETHIEVDKLIKKSLRSMTNAYRAAITGLAEMVGNRDRAMGRQIARTQKYVHILIDDMRKAGVYGEQMRGWNEDIVILSSQLYDVGKVTVSDVILNKPGKLTPEEFEQVKKHCAEGETLIEKIILSMDDEIFLRHAKNFAASHHEKWNGMGYPQGLVGEEIPLEGRIMAVVDAYDALVSERPHKKSVPHEEAVEVIRADAGSHFDPKIVEVFLTVAYKFKNVFPGGHVT